MAVAAAVAEESVFVESVSAVIAEPSAKMIFVAAPGAVIHQLTRWHCEKQAIVAVDELDVADNERLIKRDRAKRSQSSARRGRTLDTGWGEAAQVDAYFRQLHGIFRVRDSRFSGRT